MKTIPVVLLLLLCGAAYAQMGVIEFSRTAFLKQSKPEYTWCSSNDTDALGTLENKPERHTSFHDPDTVVGIINALAWPTIVLAGLVFFRKPLSAFLAGLGERVTKFSLFKIELELSKPPEANVLSAPSIDEFLQPKAAANPSSLLRMISEVLSTAQCEYAIVNLGNGHKWLTSRLFIFAGMLGRVRGLRSIVFLYEKADVDGLFLGLATPDTVRWALGRKYPYLEYSYWKQCMEQLLKPVQSYEQIPDSWSLPSGRVHEIVSKFISEVQLDSLPVQGSDKEVSRPSIFPMDVRNWTKLDDNLWEFGDWIDNRRLQDLLRSFLEEESVDEDPDQAPTDRALAILRRKGEFVAMIKKDRRFVTVA